MPMQLRTSIKPPKRFEDELLEEAQTGRTPPETITRPKSNAYRGKVIEHNPNVPPAVFPSLDPRVPTREDQQSHDLKQRKLPPNSTAPSSQRQPPSPTPSGNLETHRIVTSSHQPSQMALSAHHMDNGPGNPIWEGNMALLERLGKRNDADWVMAEMETSDEGEGSTQRKRKIDNGIQRPSWEDIPSNLHIEMLYAAVGECNKAETGMIRLNLNSIQQEIMLGELQAFNEREAIEDANIAAHQVATTNVLLTGGRKATRQDAFKSLLQTHLYKDLDRQDDVATRRQVNDARAYMASCGLDTSFLDSWQSPLAPAYTVTESDDEIDAKYPLSVSLREVMAAENAIKSTAVPCVMTPISLEPSPPPVMTKTPVQQTQNRQTPVAQPTQPASPITPPSVVDVLPLNSPTSHYSTGETTQVIADTQYTYPFGSAAPSQSLSTPRNPDPQLHAHPQTPLPPDVQYSNLPRTPEPSATPRALPWPGTPPTPSHVTLPLPETIDSDYAPKPKKQRPSASKKNSMTRKTVDQSPGSVSGTPKKVPVSLTGSSPQDEEARPSSQVTQSSPGPAEMESSSAQTDSTIAVQIPGQQSTLAAQLGLGTTNGPSSGTNPKKGKAGRGRGRPRKSQG